MSNKCEKCGVDLEEYECSRTDERLTVPHRPSQCLANLTAQCDRLATRLATAHRRESDLVDIGAHMATILYNCSQPAYDIEPRDRQVMREWCDRWDAASRERRKALAAISATGGKETKT